MIARYVMVGVGAAVITACTSGAQQNAVTSSAPLTVIVAQDGSLLVDGQVVDAATVKLIAAERTVYLQGPPDLQFSQFQRAMSDLQGLNIPIAIVGEDSKK